MFGFMFTLWRTAINVVQQSGGGTPTGDGKMDFSKNPGVDTGLFVLLEDI